MSATIWSFGFGLWNHGQHEAKIEAVGLKGFGLL
jgi:hypothetical protein